MSSADSSCRSCGPWWRLPLLLALVLAGVWLVSGRGSLQEAEPQGNIGEHTAKEVVELGKAVSLAIEFGNGNRTELPPIAWREGMTIQDAMRETFGNDARFRVRGTGESAILLSIDGVANDGASGRNWTYTVNDVSGDRSFAIYELEPGDRVLWTFGAQR